MRTITREISAPLPPPQARSAWRGSPSGRLRRLGAWIVTGAACVWANLPLHLNAADPLPGAVAGVIAYSRLQGADPTIWFAAGDGAADVPVTTGAFPRVSPDGRYMLFQRNGPSLGQGDLWMKDLVTGQETFLFDNTDYIIGSDWAIDGSRFYFDHVCSIFSRNRDNTGQVTVRNVNCYDDAPVVRPITGQMAWHNYLNNQGLWLAESNGSGAFRITNSVGTGTAATSDLHPAWSRDGEWLAFVNSGDYFKMRPDGTGRTNLTARAGVSIGPSPFGPAPAWTPDGNWIVAGLTVNNVNSLYAIATDGSGTMRRLGIRPGAAAFWVGNVMTNSALNPQSVAALLLGVNASPSPAAVGVPLVLSVDVTNLGAITASNVVVTNLLPAGVNYVGATATQGSASASADMVVAQLGPLAPNASARVEITVVPLTNAFLPFSASVAHTSPGVPGGGFQQPVTNTVLAVNGFAGNISAPGERDAFTFSVGARKRFYFDALFNHPNLLWSLTGPQGPVVTGRPFTQTDANNISGDGPILALVPGDYTLTIWASGATTPPYAFNLVDLASATLITPGAPVTASMTPANRTDFYQFTAAAGDRVQLDQLSRVNLPGASWRLVDPIGNVIFVQTFTDSGTLTLPAGGTYTLLVEGDLSNSGTGAYSFNVVPQGNTPPVPFTGTPFAIGELIVSNCVAGTTNQHLFTVAERALLLFDTQTNSPGVTWTLESPWGVFVNARGFNSSDRVEGDPLLDLPAGDYRISVRGGAGSPYRFRLLDLAGAAPIALGSVVTATLEPPNGTLAYVFTNTPGSRLYFDRVAATNLPNLHWRLIDPFGAEFPSSNFSTDLGLYSLPLASHYFLVFEGYYLDAAPGGGFSFRLVPTIDGAQALALDTTVSGAITSPGQVQRYTFTLGAEAWVYFDALTNLANVRWSLDGPTGNLVKNRAFTSSDGQNGFSLLNLPPADYTLTVSAAGDETPGYQFRLRNASAAALLTPGATVNGVLGPAKATDVYRFNVTAGSRFYFDWLGGTISGNTTWRLVDRLGQTVASGGTSDKAPFTLNTSGRHILLLEGYVHDTAGGSYSFNLVPVNDGLQSLALNTTTIGALGAPGQVQRYTFTLAAPTLLYFDSLTNRSELRWSLDGPQGNLVNTRQFTGSDGLNGSSVLNLPPADYILTVSGSGDTTGDYHFRLLELASALPITPGQVVSNALEVAKETDLYRFAAPAGARFYFDWLGGTVGGNLYWRLFDPFGIPVFASGPSDPGLFTLAENGTYTIAIEGYVQDASGGNYSFNVVPVTDGSTLLTIGAVVSGAIASPGQVQRYAFSVAGATRLYFDSLTNRAELRWALDGPKGKLFSNRGFNGSDAASGYSVFDAPAGEYVLSVYGAGDAVGGYLFRLLDFAGATPIATNITVNNSLDPGNETALYRFSAAAGDRIRLDYVSKTQLPSAFWRLADPYGEVIYNGQFNADSGVLTLAAAGPYTLSLEGGVSDFNAGTYSFMVSWLSNVPPAVLTGEPLMIGSLVSGNLPTTSSTNAYLFTLSTPARLYFDALTNLGFDWSLRGPSGRIVDNRDFLSTDGTDVANPLLALPAGDYQLTLTGAAGAYAFRLRDFADATPFTPGTVVSNTLSPARSTALYQFTATAGQRFYFDGRLPTGFTYAPYCRLYGPLNDLVMNRSINEDLSGLELPLSGTYVLTVEGRVLDDNPEGNYAFNLLPTMDGTNALTLGATLSGSVTTLGQAQRYFFNLAGPARVYFDALTNENFVWRLDTPWKQIVDWRLFSGSDGADGLSLLDLGAGDYFLTVAANNYSFTGDYQFRLLYFTNAIPFTLGTAVSNTLSPARSTVLYRFNALAGQRVYFDGQPQTGFTYAPYCRLFGPLGNFITAFSVNENVNTFELQESGPYTLTVEGRVSDHNPDGHYAFNLFAVHDGTNALALGATVSGSVTTLGEAQHYPFTLAAPTRLYFDSLTNADFVWRLDAPWGEIVNWRSFSGSDALEVGDPLLALAAGDYVLTVAANNYALTGDYLFRLLNLAGATPFTPGTAVNGTLAPARSTVLYQFNGTAGDRYYFDGLPLSGFANTPYCRLYPPDGDALWGQSVNADVDTFTLTQSGLHTLTVEGRIFDNNPAGNFRFHLVPNPPQPSTPLFQTNHAPDLIVTTLSVTPSSGLQSGQSATVNWTVQNAGNAAVNGSFTDRVLVRNTGNGQVIVNSTLPYDVGAAGALGPGDTRPRSLNITLPDGAPGAGLLEVTVTADTLNNVAEQNALATGEANNARSITITTTVAPYPDLQVHRLDVTPLTGWTPGTVVSIQWRLTNAGPRGTSNAWTDSVLVRNTSTAQFLVSTTTNYLPAALGNLGPGDVRDRVLTFTVPDNANAYGQFEISVAADSANQVFEFAPGFNAETNNNAQRVTISAPDLQVTGLALSADPSFQSGASLTARWTTVNNGNVETGGGFYDRLRVRNTNTAEVLLDVALFYNPGAAGNGAIPPGGARARSHTFTLPDGPRAAGDLEVSVAADTFNSLLELNDAGTGEANNAATVFVTTALAPYPDLRVADLRSVPPAFLSGDTVQLFWRETNSGSRATLGSWWDRILIVNTTRNLTLFDGQIYYDANVLGPLSNGAARDRSFSFALPDSTNAVGQLQITVTADRYNQVFEFVPGLDAEMNNSVAIARTATLSAYPDLRVLDLAVGPAAPFSGGDLIVSWRLTNGGNAPVSGSFSDRVTVTKPSTGLVLGTPTLVYDATQPTNGLIGVGETRDRQLVFRLPDGTNGAGALQVEVAADTFAQIIEINGSGTGELNNTLTSTFNSSLAAYPDLVAGNLRYPATGLAATPVPVSWSVTNLGPGSASGGWSEQVFLSDDTALGADQLLATFAFTNTLPPGSSITRTQNVTLPLFGAGNRWLVVRLDSADSVFEVSEANNATLGGAPITTPLGATLALSPPTVSEGAAATATLTRNGGLDGPAVFTLTSFNTNRLNVPASVSFAVSQAAASFSVTSVEDMLVLGPELVPLLATAPGYLTASNALFVLEDDEPTLAVQLSLATVAENAGPAATIGFVTRNTQTNGPLAVALVSSDADKVVVPSGVVIPAGSRTAFFDVGVVDNIVPNVTARIALSATATGFRALPATLNVTDDDTPALTLALQDAIVSEGAANPATLLTITRSPVTPARARFTLQSSDPFVATVPYGATIEANQESVSVPVLVASNNFVDGQRLARFTVYATDDAFSTPILNAVATTNLIVTDDDGPTLSVRADADVIAETGATTGTVTRNTPATSNLVVSLFSSAISEATVPPTVTLPAGQASATFPIHGVSDGVPDGTKRVTLTASAPGFNSGAAAVNVSDIDLPDLRPVAIQATNMALTGVLVPITFTVTNSGLSDADGGWVDRVYLAASAAGDGLTFVGQASHFTGLALGASYSNTVVATLPDAPGDYYVIVVAAELGALNEGSRQNNRFVSPSPISVSPAYRATIATEVDAAVAGTLIPLTGRAFRSADNAPVPNAHVTVRVTVKGTRRVFDAYADASGNISTFFRPLPNEAGRVSLSADHPGVATDTEQDAVSLYGLRFDSYEVAARVFPNIAFSNSVEVVNLGDLPLSGLTASFDSLPDFLSASVAVPASLPASGRVRCSFQLNTTNVISATVRTQLRVTSAEGAVAAVPITINVQPLMTTLVATPGFLEGGVVRGSQKVVEFAIANVGGIPSGLIRVQLPQLPWVALSSPSNLPSLGPGETNKVTLVLTPPGDTPLTRYDANLYLAGENGNLLVPVRFRVLSLATGDLNVEVLDDYTYYVEGAPKVTNATVRLTDPLTGQVVAEGNTSPSGAVFLTNLMEGAYQMRVTADQHGTYASPIEIVAGARTDKSVFIDRETVTYRWTVQPTTIEDRYEVVLEPVFQTEVPIPVVTVDNPRINLLIAAGGETQVELKLSNHGLIAAERVTIEVPQHPVLEFTPLVDVIDVLPAMSSIEIPVRVRARSPGGGGGGGGAFAAAGIPSCGTSFTGCEGVPEIGIKWSWICGEDRRWHGAQVDLTYTCTDPSCWNQIKDLLESKLKSNAKKLIKGEAVNVNELPKDCACDVINVLAICAGLTDPCALAALKVACAIATKDAKGALGAAPGLASCFCPTLHSLPSFSSPPPGPPPASGATVYNTPGPPGSFGNVLQPAFTWDYSGADCDPGLHEAAASPLPGFRPAATQPGAVCARVRIRLEQQVALTRAAFLGTLELDNGSADTPLTGVQITLDIRDEQGNSANDRFSIRGPDLSGLSGVDGSGVVAVSSTGSAKYTFVPTREAAPLGPQIYHFGGTLAYYAGPDRLEVPLIAEALTVYPDPVLTLDYFLQRDVFSDDPFTAEIEPAEPFALGLVVRNTGLAKAVDFRITSAQPRIVENEKGLLIDFKIIGTQVSTSSVSPSLSVRLGDIDAGRAQVAAFFMTASLQGKFIEYNASFKHINPLGDDGTSLIDAVNLHELIHVVQADRPGDDGAMDFLANDVPDPNHLPDTLYFSDGSLAPVELGSAPLVDGPPTVNDLQLQLAATMPPGWAYLRLPDPGPTFSLYRVVRSDGKEMRVGTNVWTTDRSFPSALAGAVRENLLHLLDFDSTGAYTLYYRVKDAVAPQLLSVGAGVPALQTAAMTNLDVVFSETIDLLTFDRNDLVLTRNGGANLIDGGVTIIGAGTNVYRLGGLGALTEADGNYQLTVLGAGVQDYGGNPVSTDGVFSWAKGVNAPVVAAITRPAPDPRNVAVTNLDVSFTKAVDAATFTPDDLILTRDGSVNLIDAGVSVTPLSATSFRVGGLEPLTGSEGHYAFTVLGSGVQGQDAAPGTGSLTQTWQVLSTGPTLLSLEAPAPALRNIVVQSLEVAFDRTIDPATFDWRDLTLTRDGGANLTTSDVTVTRLNNTTYRLGNFSWVQGLAGAYTLTVNGAGVQDAAGNFGSGVRSQTWTLELGQPAAPFNLFLTPDLGVSPGDGRTASNNVTLGGSLAEPNLTVRVMDDTLGVDLGVASVAGTAFTKPLRFAVLGAHLLRLYAVDAAQNVSSNVTFNVFIDQSPPAAAWQAVAPSPRQTPVSSLDVTFSEAVNPATFTRADLMLTRNGGTNLIDARVGVAQISAATFRVSNLAALNTPPGAYQLALNLAGIEDLAGNTGTNLVLQSWVVQGASTNRPPELVPVADRVLAEGARLVITNGAIDPDGDLLTFALGADAPPGAEIDPLTGVFSWRPNSLQGPASYAISMRISDDGQPSLSATQTFHVAVLDTLPDAVVSLGETNVFAGQSGNVPLRLDSGLSTTNLAFDVEASPARVGGFVLQSPSIDVLGANLQPLGPGRARVEIALKPGVPAQANRALLRFGFTASSNDDSAVVALRVTAVQVMRENGTPVANTEGQAGRVIVLSRNPVVVAEAGANRALLVYGRPGTNYVVEGATNLGPGAVWVPVATAFLTNNVERASVPPGPPTAFYRAREADPAGLQLLSQVGQSYTYQLTGTPGASYLLECTTNPAGAWTPMLRVPLSAAMSTVQPQPFDPGAGSVECRTREFIAYPPWLELRGGSLARPQVVIYGQPTATYQWQGATNLGSAAHWQTLESLHMTNSFRFLTLTNDATQARFYRLVIP